jgi:CDP-diacylglycerol--glycerol-3-phosphate 3-phosphatidyltransferase
MTTELVSDTPTIHTAAGPAGPPDISQYRAKDDVFTPSNIISLMRAMMVFPAIFAIVAHLYILVAAIFLTALVSDLLDGFLARRLNSVSEFGKVIDPLADKIFGGGVAIAMTAYGLVPVWFLVVILARDLVIVTAGIWARKKLGVVLPSNYPGKAAVLAIGFTLLFVITGVSGGVIVFMEYVSLALMAVSLVMYARRLGGLLKAV